MRLNHTAIFSRTDSAVIDFGKEPTTQSVEIPCFITVKKSKLVKFDDNAVSNVYRKDMFIYYLSNHLKFTPTNVTVDGVNYDVDQGSNRGVRGYVRIPL